MTETKPKAARFTLQDVERLTKTAEHLTNTALLAATEAGAQPAYLDGLLDALRAFSDIPDVTHDRATGMARR